MTTETKSLITPQELGTIFGDHLPIEAVQLFWDLPADMSIEEARQKLSDLTDALKARKYPLPCPFCGVTPEQSGYGFYHKGDETQHITCENIHCRVNPSICQVQSEYGEWDIVEAWNTRELS